MSLVDQLGAGVSAVAFLGMAGLAVYRMTRQGVLHSATVHLAFILLGCLVMAGGAVAAILSLPLAWAAVGAGMLGCVIPTALTIQPIAEQPLDPPSIHRERDLAARLVRAITERDAALAALDTAEDTIDRLRCERDTEMMRVASLQMALIHTRHNSRAVHLQALEVANG